MYAFDRESGSDRSNVHRRFVTGSVWIAWALTLPSLMVWSTSWGGAGTMAAIVAASIGLLGWGAYRVLRSPRGVRRLLPLLATSAVLASLIPAARVGRWMFAAQVRSRLGQYEVVASELRARRSSSASELTVSEAHPDMFLATIRACPGRPDEVRFALKGPSRSMLLHLPCKELRVTHMCTDPIQPGWAWYRACTNNR